jgi:hypothetical protein
VLNDWLVNFCPIDVDIYPCSRDSIVTEDLACPLEEYPEMTDVPLFR